ncbi:MAG: CHASE2 domain-containing protein [Nitrospiraceae bacterium]
MRDPSSWLDELKVGFRLKLLALEPRLGPFARLWRRLPPFAQLLLQSLTIGLGAAIFLHQARPWLPAITSAETSATDWAIKFWKDRSSDPGVGPERFVFVDVDESSYQQWGEPLFVPRDKLGRLIRFAAEAPAKLVIVDIELTKYVGPLRRPPTHAQGVEIPADPDEALRLFLDGYSREALDAKQRAGRPPMIFVRTIGQPLRPAAGTEVGGESGESDEGPLVFREERPSEFLEQVVTPSPVLHWASSLIERDDDGVLRDWRLFEPTCLKREANAVPSAALLGWALLREPRLDDVPFSVHRFRTELKRRFSPPAGYCRPEPGGAVLSSERTTGRSWRLDDPVLKKALVLSAKPTNLEHRIFYKFHPGSVQADWFSRVRASLITDPQPSQPLSSEWLAGKVVVIGASFATANDAHATPLGEMPGALVVVNELNALLEFGQIQEMSAGTKWTVLLALIVAFSVSFSYFTKTWGTRVARFLVNAILVPVSLWFFQYGWWLDVVFPLLVLQAYGRFVDFNLESPKIKREYDAVSGKA